MRLPSSLSIALVISGCAAAAPPPTVPPRAVPALSAPLSSTPRNAPAPLAAQSPRALPELGKELDAERVTGTIALFDSQEGVLGCSDVERCQKAVIPASTFKIPHSMIALESGVVDGPDTVLPWDHQQYSNDDWNQDLSFRDAFRLSCVPCYKAIARKVGEAREREWVNKLGYGNRDISGGVDKFWLSGGLRISPAEQIDFLRRFDGNKLPISERTADLVRDLMTLDVTEKYVLRGKTGSAMPPEEPQEANWFVGWLELGDRRIFFATVLDGHAADIDPRRARRSVTERILKAKGWM